METNTHHQVAQVLQQCKQVFMQKTADYGTAWRILRLSSLTDQIFIKAQRIRTIEEKGSQKVQDDVAAEFTGIVNYCIMALMQTALAHETRLELPLTQTELLYDQQVTHILTLLQAKNHDYGDAWRSMRISSFTDLILMKLLRIKQIEDNGGNTQVSEGVEAGYTDIINYAAFALIKLGKINT